MSNTDELWMFACVFSDGEDEHGSHGGGPAAPLPAAD